MAQCRTDICLGCITGKCIYENDGKDCNEHKKEECFPPVCRYMERDSSGNPDYVYCKAIGECVNPWEVCLHCNPKHNL